MAVPLVRTMPDSGAAHRRSAVDSEFPLPHPPPSLWRSGPHRCPPYVETHAPAPAAATETLPMVRHAQRLSARCPVAAGASMPPPDFHRQSFPSPWRKRQVCTVFRLERHQAERALGKNCDGGQCRPRHNPHSERAARQDAVTMHPLPCRVRRPRLPRNVPCHRRPGASLCPWLPGTRRASTLNPAKG